MTRIVTGATVVKGVAGVWGAVLSFTVFMYAVSEILANRIPTQEEYVGLTPVVAILPWLLAGSLFPVTALPSGCSSGQRYIDPLPGTRAAAIPGDPAGLYRQGATYAARSWTERRRRRS